MGSGGLQVYNLNLIKSRFPLNYLGVGKLKTLTASNKLAVSFLLLTFFLACVFLLSNSYNYNRSIQVLVFGAFILFFIHSLAFWQYLVFYVFSFLCLLISCVGDATFSQVGWVDPYAMYLCSYLFTIILAYKIKHRVSEELALAGVVIFISTFVVINSLLYITLMADVAYGGLHKYDTLVGFSNPRFYGHIQLVYILFMVCMFVDNRLSLRSVMGFTIFLSACFVFFHVLILGSRGVILSVLVSFLFLIFLASNRKYVMFLIIFFLVAVACMVIGYKWWFGGNLSEGYVNRGGSGRLVLWSLAINGIFENWYSLLTGHNYYSFHSAAKLIGRSEQHPHNFVLDMTYRFGLFFGLSLLLIVFGLLCKLIKKRLNGCYIVASKAVPPFSLFLLSNFSAVYMPAVSQFMIFFLMIYSLSGYDKLYGLVWCSEKFSKIRYFSLLVVVGFVIIGVLLMSSFKASIVAYDNEQMSYNRLYPYFLAE